MIRYFEKITEEGVSHYRIETDDSSHVGITEGVFYRYLFKSSQGCGTPEQVAATAQKLVEEKLREGFVEKPFQAMPENTLTTYYRSDWHLATGIPKTYAQARKFVGFFLRWLIEQDLMSEQFYQSYQPQAELCKKGELKGSQVIGYMSDGLYLEQLSALGNQFALQYFPEVYQRDYQATFPAYSTVYITNNEKNYQKMEKVLNDRFYEWKLKNDIA